MAKTKIKKERVDLLMEQNKETKKYSEMTFEEFLADILKIELSEPQIHMVRMFEEVKTKKVEYNTGGYISRIGDMISNEKKPWDNLFSKATYIKDVSDANIKDVFVDKKEI